MSIRYKGGRISATPPTTTGGESGVASGSWTLEQQFQAQGAGNWPLPPQPKYIEDVFSTYLYTGNGATGQTISNGIDLSGKGGLVWVKTRSAAGSHYLMDSARSNFDSLISTDNTAAAFSLNAINVSTTGFSLNGADLNDSGVTFSSWTFRKQPKFFDVVTYTGNGSNQTISHNLGSAPGCIIVKCTSNGTTNWFVYHSSLAVTSGRPGFMYLDSTSAVQTGDPTVWPSVPTSTTFEVGSYNALNGSGRTYVAYLFAHNAGGFGLLGTDNVISCGSFTTDASAVGAANLGYEPQWILLKAAGAAQNWFIFDSMRGMTALQTSTFSNAFGLNPNTSSAETDYGAVNITATGFATTSGALNANTQYIYMAIRRGPMKVPTSGTSVFAPGRGTDAASTFITTNFPSDLSIQRWMGGADNNLFSDRLRGFAKTDATASPYVVSNSTGAEVSATATNFGYTNTGFQVGSNSGGNWWALNFRRAPSFFDEVCYTGNNTGQTINHNLGVAPELIIVKSRLNLRNWAVYDATGGNTQFLWLNTSDAYRTSGTYWNSTSPTSLVFSVGSTSVTNALSDNYVAYLFASCAGVSKVGSYTGNGSTQTINCGFTGGARFVLIKRTDSTGDWYVYDTARGMTTLTDPYLLLNSTAAESATLGSVTTVSTGFAVNASILAAINTNAATYIYLAIA